MHNSKEQHISEFIKSSMFSKIMDLYQHPTIVLAFINCKKKVKAKNLKVNVTNITFGSQVGGMEENRDSKTIDF